MQHLMFSLLILVYILVINFAIKPSNGGTGRTTYNLGDLLVGNNGSSLSVLSKGTVGQVLQVSPSGGLSWGNNGGVDASTDSSGVVQFATDQQAIQQTIDDVVISPTNVTAILSNPSSIGNVTPNSGYLLISNVLRLSLLEIQ